MRVLNLGKICPAESWFGKVLRRASSHVPAGMVLPILQGPLKGKRWIAGSARHACWLGNYEVEESAVLNATIRPASIVYDLGAQAGYHSLHAAMLVGTGGKVYAFEPDQVNLSYLRKHIKLNRMSNIMVIEAAVSDFDGVSMFDQGLNRFSGHLSDTGSTPVKTIRLDQEILQSRLPVPDYLKIDVEGAELKVLSGAREILTEAHPALLIETHAWIPEFSSISDDCRKFLAGLDYQLKAITDCHIYAWYPASKASSG